MPRQLGHQDSRFSEPSLVSLVDLISGGRIGCCLEFAGARILLVAWNFHRNI
uniref:Pco077147 n=1 Tax=Arundo donax TaxID=35708 RepID=A0A0A9D849_ARUDO